MAHRFLASIVLPFIALPALAVAPFAIHADAGQALPRVSKLVMPPAPPDVAAPPADAETTPSGLAHKRLAPGTGSEHPNPTDIVTVNYTGWTVDGKAFDSSILRGKPSTFQLDKVMKGWTEAVPVMVVGETRRFWIPEELAYQRRPDRPEGTLVFDIELLGFMPAPTTPPDVKAQPADARKTRSGLASRVLRAGTGSVHPKRSSTVTVHYSGWTTDGKMFDSSVTKGQPTSFRLDGVIEGWTEGVQLMVEGERRRFWIPEDLAYKGQLGAPRGMLVFDVQLISIDK